MDMQKIAEDAKQSLIVKGLIQDLEAARDKEVYRISALKFAFHKLEQGEKHNNTCIFNVIIEALGSHNKDLEKSIKNIVSE